MSVKVTVFGPNLSVAAQKMGYFHVHEVGCQHAKHYGVGRKYGGDSGDNWTIEVASRKDIVTSLYPPDQFDYDADTEWTHYDDLYVAPCLKGKLSNSKEK